MYFRDQLTIRRLVMVKKILRSKAILLATTSLIFANASMAQSDMNDADYREVYVGADFGLSEPVIKKFSYKDEKGFKTMLSKIRFVFIRYGFIFPTFIKHYQHGA